MEDVAMAPGGLLGIIIWGPLSVHEVGHLACFDFPSGIKKSFHVVMGRDLTGKFPNSPVSH